MNDEWTYPTHSNVMYVENRDEFNDNRDLHDKLYAKAYEQGHSSGYSEIETCYRDLLDLVVFAYNIGKAAQ